MRRQTEILEVVAEQTRVVEAVVVIRPTISGQRIDVRGVETGGGDLPQHFVGPERFESVDYVRLPRRRELIDERIQEPAFGRCTVTHQDEVQIGAGNAVGIELLLGQSGHDRALRVAEDVERIVRADIAVSAVVFSLDAAHQLVHAVVDRVVQRAARHDLRDVERGYVGVVGRDLEAGRFEIQVRGGIRIRRIVDRDDDERFVDQPVIEMTHGVRRREKDRTGKN